MRTTLLISLSAVVLVFACYGLWKYTHPTSAPLDTALLEEHADQYADFAQVVSNQIVGLWQSSDDAKFKREFLSNGTSVDYYDGTVSSKDTWKAFTSEHPVATYSPLEPNTPYLQMLTDDNVALTFTVTKLTPEVLELVYLDRGGMLSFTKVTNK